MLVFQEKLTAKLTVTYKSSQDPNHTTFLKHLGEYTARKVDTTEISRSDLIFRSLEELREEMAAVRQQIARTERRNKLSTTDYSEDKDKIWATLSFMKLR